MILRGEGTDQAYRRSVERLRRIIQDSERIVFFGGCLLYTSVTAVGVAVTIVGVTVAGVRVTVTGVRLPFRTGLAHPELQAVTRPRLIATDLDGTFLTSMKEVSPTNLAAARRAAALGVPFVVATRCV